MPPPAMVNGGVAWVTTVVVVVVAVRSPTRLAFVRPPELA